jgi:DNA-binding SARP family transcriptional activator/predicted ATPase/tetratricopeptide (TPR) repeat protein
MVRLSIRLLGPLQVALDGEPVTGFASDKVRTLLAYLAVTADQPHRRETLAGILWPDYPERSARASLRNALTNLRRVIGDHDASPPFLHSTRQTIQFNRQSDCWVDVIAFAALLTSDEPTEQQLEEAVGLYRGALLEGFSVPDSAPFEEWLLLKRQQLSRQVLEALYRLVETYDERGAYEQGLPHAWRQVELEPWREQGQRQLMRLLALTGQRSAALGQYEACRRMLRDELGVEPAAETTALYEAIRSGQLTAQREVTPLGRAMPLYRLPSQPTPFVGREEELGALEELLAQPMVRLVTVLGPGGIGKTRLALQAGTLAAERQQSAESSETAVLFRHGIVFVPLGPSTSPADIVATMAQAFQLRLEEGKEQLLDYLRRKQLLLILDTLEHLLDGVGFLVEILGAAHGVKILATSRERLQLHGEHVFPIGGLGFPEQDPTPYAFTGADIESSIRNYVQEYPAMMLFVSSARRVQPQLVLDCDDLATIAQVCRLVEGMPLALELAASWADVLQLTAILAEISTSLDLMRSERRDLPARQRSIRAVFDPSWGRLQQVDQAAFARLSVFRGGFTRAAAEQVAMEGAHPGAALRQLSRLVSKSFLQYNQSNDRYQIHELLRQYGAEKLAQDGPEEAEAHDRYCAYYAAALQRWGEDSKGPRHQMAVAEMEAESQNLHLAWDWAAEHGQVERLDQALEGLCLFHMQRGRYEEGETACQWAAENLWNTESGYGLRLLVKILAWQSAFSHELGHVEWAQQALRQSQTIVERPDLADLDTRQERAFLLQQMARMVSLSSYQESERLLEQSLALHRAVDDRWAMANVLVELSWNAERRGSYSEARALCEESLAMFRALGDQRGIARSLWILGVFSWSQGHFEDGERLAHESFAICQEIGDRDAVAGGLNHLGQALLQRGQFAEGHQLLAESMATYRDLGSRRVLAYEIPALVDAEAHLGRYESARAHAQQGLTIGLETADLWSIGAARSALGLVALAAGTYPQAHQSLLEGVSAFRQIGHRPSLACSVAILAFASRGLGQRAQARQQVAEALRIATDSGAFFPLIFALVAMALLRVDEGELEQAVELYALASRTPYVANSRWFEDVAGREIAHLAAGLSSEAVEAAHAHGQAMDLWQKAAELRDELSDTDQEAY